MDSQISITTPTDEGRHTNVGIFVSGFFVLLFLATAFTFPLNNDLLNRLNPKPASFASNTDYVVFPDTTIVVPIDYVGDVAATELDFTVNVTGGVLVELQCGGSDFTSDQVRSRGSRCLVTNPDGKSDGSIAQAVVTTGPAGTLSVIATGTTRTKNEIVSENSPLTTLEYEISGDDIKVGKKVIVPIVLDSPKMSVTAADFTITAGGATLDDVVCGGLAFRNTGVIRDTNRCVVLSQKGHKNATVASAIVSTTTAGTVTISATGTVSDGTNNSPADGAIVGNVFSVVQ
ncbi:hypothetical protein HGA91_02600 [candidate division WWE3 bacterium]|nr:hypothetical protein [candidate division WWE3 bacterium]